MGERKEGSAAMLGSRFLCDCLFFWSCKNEKGHQRISIDTQFELPFAPTVGMHIDLGEETPAPKVTEVIWRVREQEFSVSGEVELVDWDAKLFESLMDDFRAFGYSPKLHYDNWMHRA